MNETDTLTAAQQKEDTQDFFAQLAKDLKPEVMQ